MTQQLLTRCPNCETLFKLYPRQIEAAGGFVRCGSCMKVFKAHKHILDPLELPTVDTLAEATPTAATKKPHKPQWSEELTDDIDKIYQHLATELSEHQAIPQPGSHRPSQIAELAQQNPHASAETPPAVKNKSAKSRLPKFEDDLTDSFKNLPLSGSGQEAPRQQKVTDLDEIDESWAEKMLKELDEFSEAVAPPNSTPSPQLQSEETGHGGLLNPALSDSLIQELSAKPDTGEPSTPLKIDASTRPERKVAPEKPIFSKKNPRLAVVDNSLQLMPLDNSAAVFQPNGQHRTTLSSQALPDDTFYAQNRHRRHQPLSIGYTIGCVLMMVALVIEYGFFNFETLNQNEVVRPLYVIACQAISCRVPPRQDMDKIVNLNVVVQQHPSIDQALRANILISNQATFAQPFPQLKLTFTDLHQQILAERVFTPNEYQKDELKNLTLMPSNQPIRLMFDFWDPGQAAVSSELAICQMQNQVLRCKS
jgi:hypothetical protein